MSANALKKQRYKFKFKVPTKVAKPNIIYVPKEQWTDIHRPMFKWADIQIAKHGYNGNTAHVLKELVSCADKDGCTYVTIDKILERLISKLGKAAPCRRTIDNCIATLVAKKSIKRPPQIKFKTPVRTRLLLGKLVVRSTQLLRANLNPSDLSIGGEVLQPPPPPNSTKETCKTTAPTLTVGSLGAVLEPPLDQERQMKAKADLFAWAAQLSKKKT